MHKLVAFGLASILSASSFAADKGTVISLSGTAKNITTASDLKKGSSISMGDRISTGPDSIVRIKVGDDIALQLGPTTEVIIESPARETVLTRLISGHLMAAVRKALRRNDRLKIRTHDSVMGVRGTVLFVREQSKNKTFLCVCTGTVGVNGRTITSKRHDYPQYIHGGRSEKATDGDYGHTDAETNEMQKLADAQS